MMERTAKRWLQAVGAAVLVTQLWGCAAPPPKLPQEQVAGLRRVAVVSRTADVFTRQYTGMTVFNNQLDRRNVADWRLDKTYEAQIGSELQGGYGMTVVDAPYDPVAFEHVNDLNGPWSAPAFLGSNWGAIEATTRAYCTANNLDAVVVVAKMHTNDVLAGTNQSYGGLGLYARGPGMRVAVLHLFAKMALLDCRTGKPLAERVVSRNQAGLYGDQVRSAPLQQAPEDLVFLPVGEWTDAQATQVKTAMTELPAGVWAPTLRSILPGGQ